MPIAGTSTYALVIVSLGILGVIVSFLITERKKYVIALSLSLLVIVMGAFQFVTSSLRQWRTAHRIARLQESQRLNLEALQSRLREASDRARANPAAPAVAPTPASAPAVQAPAPAKKKK